MISPKVPVSDVISSGNDSLLRREADLSGLKLSDSERFTGRDGIRPAGPEHATSQFLRRLFAAG
jgi:hypothetical protein